MRGERRATLAALLLMLGFAGQTFGYYAITSWLPTQLAQTLGAGLIGAGLSAALFQAGGVAGPFVADAALRRAGTAKVFIGVGALWLFFPLGMLTAPSAWWAWGLAAGIAQGATFTVVLVVIAAGSGDQHRTRRASALVQGGGYAGGAIGPVLLGVVHEASGTWTAPMLVVVGAVAVLVTAGVGASLLTPVDARVGRAKAMHGDDGRALTPALAVEESARSR